MKQACQKGREMEKQENDKEYKNERKDQTGN